MAASIKVLGLSGSLRKASTNSGLLRYAASIAPRHNLAITIGSIGDLPLYNADVEAKGWPEPVKRLRGQAREATGVLIAAPEYNYSIPGTLVSS
jgi:chromate reductase